MGQLYFIFIKTKDGTEKEDYNGERDEEHARTGKVPPEICGEQKSSQSTCQRQTEMKTETKLDTEMNT